jgi:isoquinoline 1-oxidoreductase subunit beta
VRQSIFHDYPLPRMTATPVIDVHILPSPEAPGGMGESSVQTVAPAATGTTWAAPGKRTRSLPISRHAFGKA